MTPKVQVTKCLGGDRALWEGERGGKEEGGRAIRGGERETNGVGETGRMGRRRGTLSSQINSAAKRVWSGKC